VRCKSFVFGLQAGSNPTLSAIFDAVPVKLIYSPAEVVAMTGRSRRTIIRWFENEPGVVLLEILDHPEKLHKRCYRTIRIPRTVFDHVIARRISEIAH